jgi:hypothetical protein
METQTHITKTEFETSFFDVSLSDFDLYILKKYLFIPLLVICIPILWVGPSFAVHHHLLTYPPKN